MNTVHITVSLVLVRVGQRVSYDIIINVIEETKKKKKKIKETIKMYCCACTN